MSPPAPPAAQPTIIRLLPHFIRRKVEHRPGLVKILENIGWLFFDKVLRMGVGLLVGVWVARYLGPEQFGLLNFALAFTGLFGAIATLGLQGIVVRDIVRDPEGAKVTLGTAAILQFIGGLVAYLLIFVAIAYLRPDDALARTIVAILGSMMLLKASEVAVYWFESQVQSKYTVWVQNSVFLLFAAIKVLLILQEAPLIAFAWVMLAEAAVVALILLVVMGLRGHVLTKLSASPYRAKTLLRNSWPLTLSGVVLMVQARIDQIMLGQMIGDVEVGYYSVALRIIEVAAVSAMILRSTFLPSIIAAKKTSEANYLLKLEAFYKLNSLVAFAIGIPLMILSPWIIKILFGEAYSPAALIMSLMTLRLFFAHIGVPRGIYLLNENLMRYSMVTMIVGTLVNISLNFWLIPLYMGVGATIASLVSFFVTIFAIDIFYSKTKANAHLMLKSTLTCGSLLRRKLWVL